MTDARHRKVDRKRGVKLRRKQGRRRTTIVDQELNRQELRVAARADRTRRSRRRIILAIIGALVIALSAWPLATWLDQRAANQDNETPAGVLPTQGVSALIAVVDDSGRAMAVTLVSASDTGNDRVVFIHPSLLTTLPGFGEHPLSESTRFEGPGLLGTSVANLLGVRIDAVAVWSEASLRAAIADVVVVDLPEPFVVEDGTSQIVIAGTGPMERDGIEILRFLTEKGVGNELDLMQRQGAVWEALLDEIVGDVGFLERLVFGSGSAVRDALIGVATGDPVLTIVPATLIETTGSAERYQLDGTDAAVFTATNIAYLQLATEPRVRVAVLNGNGLIGTTQPVAALLVNHGYRVVLTDNADESDIPTTLIVAQGREFRSAAVAVREVLGLGDVSVDIQQPSGVFDVTIIVGEDLPAGGEG